MTNPPSLQVGLQTRYKRLLGFARDLSLLPFASAVVSRLSVYATLVLAAHLLDGEQFGTYAVCLVVIGLIVALVTGGGDMWLNRFTGQVGATTGQAPRLWPVYFVAVLTISAVVLALSATIELAGLPSEPYQGLGLATAAAAVLSGATEALLATLRAGGSLRLFFIVRDMAAPLAYLALLAWRKPDTTLDALLLYVSLWSVLFLGTVARLLWRAPQMLPAVRPPRIAWLPVAQHTFGLIFGNLTSRLATHLDILVLASFVSMTAVGEYRVAAQFAIGFMVIQHFVFLGLPWELRYFRSQGGSSAGTAVVARRQKLLVSLATAGGIVISVLATPLLGLLGDRFVEMTAIFRLLIVMRFASLLWGPQHEVLISNRLPTQDAYANVTSLLVWVATFVFVQPFLGSFKAALAANLLSAVAGHLYRLAILRRYRLPEIYGHPFGPAAPLVISGATMGLIHFLTLP